MSEAGADARFDVSVWIWISSRPKVKTAALLVLEIHGETSSGAFTRLECKESADNSNGRVLVVGPSVAVGSGFCEASYEDESNIVVEETERGSRVLSYGG